MPDYQLGKIYKIECNVTGKVYIGSTCEPILARRLAGHITSYKRYLNGTSNYVSSFKIFENGDYCIILLEKYPCDTKDELLARERHWCNELECINQRKCQGMYNLLGEKGFAKYYYENNKDMIHAKKKEYYNDNKNKLIEKSKEYYKQNKDIIRVNQNEKHECTCGGKYTHVHKQQHIRSAKHQQYIYYIKHKTIIDGLNMIKALDKYFNTI